MLLPIGHIIHRRTNRNYFQHTTENLLIRKPDEIILFFIRIHHRIMNYNLPT